MVVSTDAIKVPRTTMNSTQPVAELEDPFPPAGFVGIAPAPLDPGGRLGPDPLAPLNSFPSQRVEEPGPDDHPSGR
jgi:hypothetical protein